MTIRINVYDKVIKYPTAEELKQAGRSCFLVYVTPFVGSIVEYSGRTCYRSFDKIKEESYKTFISNITKSGHESVIEHSNLVYILFKDPDVNPAVKDANETNRHLITLMMYNGLLNVSETKGFYIISGNIRMFKDLVREYFSVKDYNPYKYNPIIEDILSSFYTLPKYFFLDMIQSGKMKEANFKPNPNLQDATSSLVLNKLNDYVAVLNHDDVVINVRGYKMMENGVETVKRLNPPSRVMEKHKRITLVIHAPRYITHQIVRHRIASYSQVSQRYCLEEGLNVYVPESMRTTPGAEAIGMQLFNNALTTYKQLIDLDVKKEDARSVLTNAQMSTVIMTATVESFRHFIAVRADKAAQNFIRDMIAYPLKNYLERYANEHRGERSPKKIVEPAKSATSTVTRKPNNKARANFKPKYKKPANTASTPASAKETRKPRYKNQPSTTMGTKPAPKNGTGGNTFKRKGQPNKKFKKQ